MKHLRLFNENFNTNLVDTLLDKIHNNGMSSLTSDELNYLKNPTPETEKKLIYRQDPFIYNDQNFGIKYEHYFSEHNGNNIFHYGKLVFNHYPFEGYIVCDINGEFEEASFKISSNISDEHYSAGDDLYYVGEGLEHEIDKFFADDVCPNLSI